MRHINEGVATSTVNNCLFSLIVLKFCEKLSSLKLVPSGACKRCKNTINFMETY